MHLLPLSEQDSLQLTKSVVAFQSQATDPTLYTALHKQTQQLLYELPCYLHLLEEEECCDFLFFCYDAIPHYLTTYREGRLSYLGYLSQVVRKRSRYFIAQKHVKQRKEQLIAESDYYNRKIEEVGFTLTAEPEDCYYTNLVKTDLDHLPQLFTDLAQIPKTCITRVPHHLEKLKHELQKPAHRKRFLLMLTISPDLTSQYLLEDLSSLLDVDKKLLLEYLNTANSYLAQKKLCKEEFEVISHRHFRRLLEIEAQMQRETDEQELKRLEELRQWTKRVYIGKVEQIRNLEMNLTHSELAALLGIPKGTVDSSIHYMKKQLSHCMDEQRDKQYL